MIELLDKVLWLVVYVITLPLNIAFTLVDLLAEMIFALADGIRKAAENKRLRQTGK